MRWGIQIQTPTAHFETLRWAQENGTDAALSPLGDAAPRNSSYVDATLLLGLCNRLSVNVTPLNFILISVETRAPSSGFTLYDVLCMLQCSTVALNTMLSHAM